MMKIRFEDKERVIANFMGHDVVSDVPVAMGGEDAGLNPFHLFLASIGNCAGVFMKMFYRNHNIPLDGASLEQEFEFHENGMLKKVVVNVNPGPAFPREKQAALLAMIRNCKVKKHLDPGIEFEYIVK